MSVKECNFAISPGAIGRFSVNCYVRRGNATMVLRVIPDKIPTLDELQLPARLKEMALEKRGFVVFFAGATGSAKSNSLAAMIRLAQRACTRPYRRDRRPHRVCPPQQELSSVAA